MSGQQKKQESRAHPFFPEERDHSACGVYKAVNLPYTDGRPAEPSHEIILQTIQSGVDLKYRSAINPMTLESDGAGVKFYGLPAAFFNRIIYQFIGYDGQRLPNMHLQSKRFGIGRYFFQEEYLDQAQILIEQCANNLGLKVVGWRDLDQAMNLSLLSPAALASKPIIMDALILPENRDLDPSILQNLISQMELDSGHQSQVQDIPFDSISVSSVFLTYKGMIHADQLFIWEDLLSPLYTAIAADTHVRAATGKKAKWNRAQPFWVAHNGEFTTKKANARHMALELKRLDFKGIQSYESSSDSQQFGDDLLNQMGMLKFDSKGFSVLVEAFIRLMTPLCSSDYSDEINAMLKCFYKNRPPYNGPGFVATGDGFHLLALDRFALRPSRLALVEYAEGRRQFIAASDDFIEESSKLRIIKKWELAPGGMLVITPEGEILETHEILQRLNQTYNQDDPESNYFTKLYAETTVPLVSPAQALALKSEPPPFQSLFPNQNALHRCLLTGAVFHENIDFTLYMAKHGVEITKAMGNDKSPLLLFHSLLKLPHPSTLFQKDIVQVTAPSLDYPREITNFHMGGYVGPQFDMKDRTKKQILIDLCVLEFYELAFFENHPLMPSKVLDMTYLIDPAQKLSSKEAHDLLSEAIKRLLRSAHKAIESGAKILIVSDRSAGSHRLAIPDTIAAAALRTHLEGQDLIQDVSFIVDSMQMTEPHHLALAVGCLAIGVYPRGGYEIIHAHYPGDHAKLRRYRQGLVRSLGDTLAGAGIPDMANYIGAAFFTAMGLDLSERSQDVLEEPSLGNIFGPELYSPFKGVGLHHFAYSAALRHAEAYSSEKDFTVLPRAGRYLNEKGGAKHGYGAEVVNATAKCYDAEKDRFTLFRIHQILKKRYPSSNYLAALVRFDPKRFGPDLFNKTQGFIDPREKSSKGFYPPEYLEDIQLSPYFRELFKTINEYDAQYPTAITHYFKVEPVPQEQRSEMPFEVESTASIRSKIHSGQMSQLALTAADPENPAKKGAHETITAGANAVGIKSGSGEGGQALPSIKHDLYGDQEELYTCTDAQIASGRFGINAEQIMLSEEMEIKIGQGAKRGRGGKAPGLKVTIRFAAQRGGLPGTTYESPATHHDIYCIEDLARLIEHSKRVNPKLKVAVKISAMVGAGSVANGSLKGGADALTIAGREGGTGAAGAGSIDYDGFPGEISVVEVDLALKEAKVRDLIKIRISGGIKTPDQVIVYAIMGTDEFSAGTFPMLAGDCRMKRTCNEFCEFGVANNLEYYKGDEPDQGDHLNVGVQRNVSALFVALAAGVQEKLRILGVPSLEALKGRVDLLKLVDPAVAELYDFSMFMTPPEVFTQPSPEEIAKAQEYREQRFKTPKEDALIEQIKKCFAEHPNGDGQFCSEVIHLTTQDLTFGGRIAGEFARYLRLNPLAKIIINTNGCAGHGYGFVMCRGMEMRHVGPVGDDCGASMTGGVLSVITPNQGPHYLAHENTGAGNVFCYGASGGQVYINMVAGHRGGMLGKGSEAVFEGLRARPFSFTTSGTWMLLEQPLEEVCAGASGGIIFIYNQGQPLKLSNAVRSANFPECQPYEAAIHGMLKRQFEKTGSVKAREILDHFNLADFSVLIPLEMERVSQTLQELINIVKVYKIRDQSMTAGMEVWFLEKMRRISMQHAAQELAPLNALLRELPQGPYAIFSPSIYDQLIHISAPTTPIEDLSKRSSQLSASSVLSEHELTSLDQPRSEVVIRPRKTKKTRPVKERLAPGMSHELDDVLLGVTSHFGDYVAAMTTDAKGCSGCSQGCSGGESLETGCPKCSPIHTINSTLKQLGPVDETGLLTVEQWRGMRAAAELQTGSNPQFGSMFACPAFCGASCTETGARAGGPNPHRGGKLTGQPVEIKTIENRMYLFMRSFGLFHTKVWTPDEVRHVFGKDGSDGIENKKNTFDRAMEGLVPYYERFPTQKVDRELILVGSGPAAMLMAYLALLKGLKVSMYEQSDKAGGLPRDNIPHYKFMKEFLDEDLMGLVKRGLKLTLKAKVSYDKESGEYRVKDASARGYSVIASADNKKQYVALCVGAGHPRMLPHRVTQNLSPEGQKKIFLATHFLKACNDYDDEIKKNPNLTDAEREFIYQSLFGDMDIRHKRVAVFGGGDTKQDWARQAARIKNRHRVQLGLDASDEEARAAALDEDKVYALARNPEPGPAGTWKFPFMPSAATPENLLQIEELDYIEAENTHLVEPAAITETAQGKLNIRMRKLKFSYYEEIKQAGLLPEFEKLPRAYKALDQEVCEYWDVNDIDIIFLAIGFEGELQIIQDTEGVSQSYRAGDAAQDDWSIVHAQASAMRTFENKIWPAIEKDLQSEQEEDKDRLSPRGSLLFFNVGSRSKKSAAATLATSASVETLAEQDF